MKSLPNGRYKITQVGIVLQLYFNNASRCNVKVLINAEMMVAEKVGKSKEQNDNQEI